MQKFSRNQTRRPVSHSGQFGVVVRIAVDHPTCPCQRRRVPPVHPVRLHGKGKTHRIDRTKGVAHLFTRNQLKSHVNSSSEHANIAQRQHDAKILQALSV